METQPISKKAINDLIRLKEEFESVIESIELIGDKKFMKSYNKAKGQIKKRKFADWNGL